MTSSLILQRVVHPRLARSLYGASAFSTAATPSSSTSGADSPPQLPPFDYQPKPYAGPTADEVLAKRKKFLCPSIYHFYQKLVNIVEGKIQYLFDESGRRYLDAIAGIVTVSCGHCHPDVLEAITEQSKLLQHATTIYLHHAIGDFAEALAFKMPDLKSLLSLKEGVQFYCKSCEGTLTRAPIRRFVKIPSVNWRELVDNGSEVVVVVPSGVLVRSWFALRMKDVKMEFKNPKIHLNIWL